MLKNICFIFLSITLNLFAYINIYPVSFDKSIDGNGNAQEFILYNKTNKSIRYNISLSDDRFKKSSMKNWIEFYPKNVTIKPGKSEKIKMYIKSPKNTEKGEYLSTLEIKELLVPQLDSSPSKGSGVTLLTHLKMDIVGYVGDLKPVYNINGFSYSMKNNNLSVKGTLKNSGDRRGKVALILSSGKNKESYTIGKLKVNKNEIIDLSILSHELQEMKLPKKITKLFLKDEDSNNILLELSL